MIISASRRTDIPAFYPKWFLNRVKAGYCAVPNPFNRKQVSYISLQPEDVDVIVFWTRNPKPLFSSLNELDSLDFHYYFQYTIVNNPRQIDPYSPTVEKAIKTFIKLAERIGPQRVIWRYDPIAFSNLTPPQFHIDNYLRIAEALKGHTVRSVISIMDDYRRSRKRIADLNKRGIIVNQPESLPDDDFNKLIYSLIDIAKTNNMEIVSCAENINLEKFAVKPGKCIDDNLIRDVFQIDVTSKKDPSQRKECGCVASRDIGMYDSCLFGCRYCYATQSFELARRNFKEHNPESPSLVGWHEVEPPKESGHRKKLNQESKTHQLKLF